MDLLAIKEFRDILEAKADRARTHDSFVTVCELLQELEIRETHLEEEMDWWAEEQIASNLERIFGSNDSTDC